MATCAKCGGTCPSGWTTCQKCTVQSRVGADYFECECGATVPINESVRMMRKTTHRIERVCNRCATEGACKAGAHVIQTPQKPGYDASKWTFDPVPDNFPRGYCSACSQQMYFDGQRWGRMDWAVLATAWEASDA